MERIYKYKISTLVTQMQPRIGAKPVGILTTMKYFFQVVQRRQASYMNIVVTPSSMGNDHEGSCNSQIELCCGACRAITSLALCPKNIDSNSCVYVLHVCI